MKVKLAVALLGSSLILSGCSSDNSSVEENDITSESKMCIPFAEKAGNDIGLSEIKVREYVKREYKDKYNKQPNDESIDLAMKSLSIDYRSNALVMAENFGGKEMNNLEIIRKLNDEGFTFNEITYALRGI